MQFSCSSVCLCIFIMGFKVLFNQGQTSVAHFIVFLRLKNMQFSCSSVSMCILSLCIFIIGFKVLFN
jgi:hypothetical protein